MMERDYPVGHPAASDYAGEKFVPKGAVYSLDYPAGHPAHGGANAEVLSTPDGMRAAQNAQSTNLQELAMVGSLPPLRDPATGDQIDLAPHELAHIYAVRKGLSAALAQEITDRYKLTPDAGRSSEPGQQELTPEQQSVMYIVALGYTPERAKELFDKYGAPSVLADKEADAHR